MAEAEDGDAIYERGVTENVKRWQEERKQKSEYGTLKIVQVRQETHQVIILKKRRSKKTNEKDPDC